MENLHTESRLERRWAALLEQMQQTLYVVKEAVTVSYTHKDLVAVSDPRLSFVDAFPTSYKVSKYVARSVSSWSARSGNWIVFIICESAVP